MIIQDTIQLHNNLKFYIGQPMQPHALPVIEVITVPSKPKNMWEYLRALVKDYSTNIKNVTLYDNDFTVIVLFSPIKDAIKPETFRWTPYEVFLHTNELQYTKG